MSEPKISVARQAGGILAAWARKDLDRLEAELTRSAALDDAGGDAAERERMDLLESIAAEMRQELADLRHSGEPSERGEACVRLLQHLAAGENGSRLWLVSPRSRRDWCAEASPRR
jgi:hypothetical protein